MKTQRLKTLPTIIFFALLVLLVIIVIVRINYLKPSSADNDNSAEGVPAVLQEVDFKAESEITPVTLGGVSIDPSSSRLVLNSDVTADELRAVLPALQALSSVDAQQCRFSANEKRLFVSSYPNIQFEWNICIADSVYSGSQTQISIPGPEQVAEYASFSDLLPCVTEIELCGGDYTARQAAAISEAWPSAQLSGTIAMLGQSFSIDSEELDFSDTKISLEETQEFASLIAAMPSLKKVIMSDCGIADEDMDALDQAYPSVRFVWTVHFKVYDVRTDTDRFCVSDLPWNGYVAWPMTDKDFAPIKYCRDLIALDLGHENISDLSFLYNMPKLKYLIIAIEHNTFDLTPVASLKNLYYLEVFNNELLDISPLTECKNLKHLNISNTRGDYSIEPLFQMTQLDRLWFALNHLTEEEKEALRTALPNTEIYLEQTDSVGGSWRECEVYDELHEALFAPGH